MGVSTDLCASGGDVWVQYGWGKFDCIHCKCSCGRRRALPCAAAVLSESGNASHREGKRWPCLTLQRKQLYQRLITGRSKVRLFHNFSFIWPVACISANMSSHLNNYVRIRVEMWVKLLYFNFEFIWGQKDLLQLSKVAASSRNSLWQSHSDKQITQGCACSVIKPAVVFKHFTFY